MTASQHQHGTNNTSTVTRRRFLAGTGASVLAFTVLKPELVRGAKSYEIQISADPPTPTSWTAKMTASKSSATIQGLTSGAKLWARVRAVGADNQPGPWSDPATKVVP